jgi:hypothetical protein
MTTRWRMFPEMAHSHAILIPGDLRRLARRMGKHPANRPAGLIANLAFGLCILSLLVLSSRAHGQGCASCYTTAAAGGAQTAHALRSGILVLLFPPVLIFGAVLFLVRHWKRQPTLWRKRQ